MGFVSVGIFVQDGEPIKEPLLALAGAILEALNASTPRSGDGLAQVCYGHIGFVF